VLHGVVLCPVPELLDDVLFVSTVYDGKEVKFTPSVLYESLNCAGPVALLVWS
jgi:hypothetical protein